MKQVTSEEKETLTKVFAILGFIVLIIFIVWIAVRIVSILPSAFSSLASLADSVYNYDRDEEFVVTTGSTVVNAGESFMITWSDMRQEGTYAFSYECTEGVSIEVKNAQGDIMTVACDTPLELNDATSIEVLVASEKYRFVDIPYTISFARTGTEEAVAIAKTVTIVNASIPASGAVVEEDTDIASSTPTVTEPTPAAPVKTTPVYTQGKPTTIKKIVYSVPVSDPKGDIDLQVTFIGVGELDGKVFIPSKDIEEDEEGAIQFEVKNIGTKTASDWSYEAHLPSDITYTSGDQKALKPNERAIITLGFEGITKNGTEEVEVEVTAKGDVKKSNNDFEKSVKIVD